MKTIVKYGIVFLFVMAAIVGKNVYAEEIYYTNSKGVSFTKEQYDFYTYLTHDGYQEYVTQDMLNEIAGEDLESLDVKVVRLCPNPFKSASKGQTRDDEAYVATSAKSLAMGRYCTQSYCRVMAEVEWFGEPNITSYDVMGAYLDGPTRVGTPSTFLSTPTTGYEEETIVYDTDGFGAIIQLPAEEGIFIDQTFVYSGTGTIFMSYQHAMSNISLANSQLFNIGLIGYGSVFDFYGAAVDVYDDMPGVHMDV